MQSRNSFSAKKIAFIGLFIALASVMAYIEAIIPVPIPIPGVKLGLCNIVIVFVLYFADANTAFIVSIARALVIFIIFGNAAALFYSVLGASFSILFMALLKKTKLFSVIGVSAGGGFAHITGQMIAAITLAGKAVLRYYPILALSGVITGIIIGALSLQILKLLHGKFELEQIK